MANYSALARLVSLLPNGSGKVAAFNQPWHHRSGKQPRQTIQDTELLCITMHAFMYLESAAFNGALAAEAAAAYQAP